MIITKPTQTLMVKQAAGTDCNFDYSGVDSTDGSSGIPKGVAEQGALSSTAASLFTTPASGHTIACSNLKITNTGANSRDITVYHPEDGSTVTAATQRDFFTLLASESAEWTPAGGWKFYDAAGREYGVTLAATQTDQESATSLTTYVSPGTQQFHPSSCKAWGEFGVAADITASYNITSLTDTGTGVIGVTIATDFSSANYCVVPGVEATGTTWAVANSREVHVRNATLAAGSFSMDCIDNTTTTNLVKDPTHWFAACFGDQ